MKEKTSSIDFPENTKYRLVHIFGGGQEEGIWGVKKRKRKRKRKKKKKKEKRKKEKRKEWIAYVLNNNGFINDYNLSNALWMDLLYQYYYSILYCALLYCIYKLRVYIDIYDYLLLFIYYYYYYYISIIMNLYLSILSVLLTVVNMP